MASTSESRDKTVITGQYAGNSRLNDSEIQLIKTEFNEKLCKHFLSTRNSKEQSLMSRNCVDPLLFKIKKEEEKSRLDNNYINMYQDNYTIVESFDGKERLLKKDDDGKYKVILPWEDMFDIFFESHLKYSHPGTETLRNILREDYILNDFAIQNIYDVCYICSIGLKPYFRCTLDIISMSDIPNYAFASIMAYQDMFTGFIHLRPLSADNKASEVCMELLQIFTDFGPPKEVVISSEIFEIAIDQINHLTICAPIPIEVTKVQPNENKIEDLRRKIKDWLKDSNIKNWAIGCYGAQWYLNNESVGPHQKSPFANVFRKLKSFSIKNMLEEEFDWSDVPSPKRKREVSTVSDRTSVELVTLDMSSPEEEQLDTNEEQLDTNQEEVDTSEPVASIETTFTITSSDDDLAEFEEKDPLDIDESVLSVNIN